MRAAADRDWAARETEAAVLFATSREETRNADSQEYNVLKLSLDAQVRKPAEDLFVCRLMGDCLNGHIYSAAKDDEDECVPK